MQTICAICKPSYLSFSKRFAKPSRNTPYRIMLITPSITPILIYGVTILGRVQVRSGSHGSAGLHGGCPPMKVDKWKIQINPNETIRYDAFLSLLNRNEIWQHHAIAYKLINQCSSIAIRETVKKKKEPCIKCKKCKKMQKI